LSFLTPGKSSCSTVWLFEFAMRKLLRLNPQVQSPKSPPLEFKLQPFPFNLTTDGHGWKKDFSNANGFPH